MKRILSVIIVGVVLGTAGFWVFSEDAEQGSASLTVEERHELGGSALEQIKAEGDAWPGTPEAVIAEFWESASQKDYERLTLLCPGTTAAEFKKYYDQYPPSSASAIGKPEPHPSIPEVKFYRTKVPFPGFPNKTLKMAVRQYDGQHWVIDGENTVWW